MTTTPAAGPRVSTADVSNEVESMRVMLARMRHAFDDLSKVADGLREDIAKDHSVWNPLAYSEQIAKFQHMVNRDIAALPFADLSRQAVIADITRDRDRPADA